MKSSDQLGVYVQEKAEQIDRLKSSLAAVLTSEQAQLQAIKQREPGWTASKKAHAQWEQQVARQKDPITRQRTAIFEPLGLELSRQMEAALAQLRKTRSACYEALPLINAVADRGSGFGKLYGPGTFCSQSATATLGLERLAEQRTSARANCRK